MKKRSHSPFRLVLPVSLLAFLAPIAFGQDPPAAADGKGATIPTVPLDNPDELIKNGDEAFAKGDWITAAANYAGLMEIAKKTGAEPSKIEPLYFALGVAYFNIPHYEKAKEIFNEYITKYPKGNNVYQSQLAIARILRAEKKWPEAIQKYEPLKNGMAFFKDDVNIELAECYVENQQKDKAIVLLETALAPGIKSLGEVRQALKLVDLYMDDKPEKGVKLLDRVKRSPGARPMVMEINFMALKLADELMSSDEAEQALQAYQNLRKKSEVVDRLKSLIADYERAVVRLNIAATAKTVDAPLAAERLGQTKLFLAQAKLQLTELEKQKSYDAIVFFRISRCFAALGRYWEAKLGMEWVYATFPDFEDRATVLYILIYSYYNLVPANVEADGLKLGAETEKLCRRYLQDYPDGANVGEVAEMLIATAQKGSDPAKVNAIFDEVMTYLEKSPNKAQFLAIQVQNYLEQWETAKAREAADRFIREAPDSALLEDVEYMRALTIFFENDYKGSLEALRAYREKYPAGKYLPDARYRMANILKGEEMANKKDKKPTNFLSVIEECQSIIDNYPESPTVGDCYALIGDVYKEMPGDEVEERKLDFETIDQRAAEAYMKAVERGASDEVVEYSLGQARPLLMSQGKWKDIENMYRGFLKNHPNHINALEAIGWIGKAIIKQATNAEERVVKEAESRNFLADTILENINDARKEGVEDLLQQLAVSCVPKRKTPKVEPGPDGKPGPRPDPPTVAEVGAETEAEFDSLLGLDSGTLSNIAKARMVFVKSRLYEYLEMRTPKRRGPDKKVIEESGPKKSATLMEQLISEFATEDYSAQLLAVVGDDQMKRGNRDRAAACYSRLIQYFPNSPYIDWALVGQGKMNYEDGDKDGALKKFTEAVEQFPGMKYGDALLGLSKVQIDIGKLDEAEKSLKEITGDKSYGKEMHAAAIYSLAEIQVARKDLAGAFNYFQRLYLSFRAFPEWAAKGYLNAGRMKEELGKGTDAVDVYKEATSPAYAEKLKDQPELKLIKDRLRALGQ